MAFFDRQGMGKIRKEQLDIEESETANIANLESRDRTLSSHSYFATPHPTGDNSLAAAATSSLNNDDNNSLPPPTVTAKNGRFREAVRRATLLKQVSQTRNIIQHNEQHTRINPRTNKVEKRQFAARELLQTLKANSESQLGGHQNNPVFRSGVLEQIESIEDDGDGEKDEDDDELTASDNNDHDYDENIKDTVSEDSNESVCQSSGAVSTSHLKDIFSSALTSINFSTKGSLLRLRVYSFHRNTTKTTTPSIITRFPNNTGNQIVLLKEPGKHTLLVQSSTTGSSIPDPNAPADLPVQETPVGGFKSCWALPVVSTETSLPDSGINTTSLSDAISQIHAS